MIIRSSLNTSAVSGIAQIRISAGKSFDLRTRLSGSTKYIPFLYSELLLRAELKSENCKCASNFPLLVILNVVEFIFFIEDSFLSAEFFPISIGPKSKTFSESTYDLLKNDSGLVVGLVFLQFQKIFLGRLEMLGKSHLASTWTVAALAKNDSN